jgi:hypothetical protein
MTAGQPAGLIVVNVTLSNGQVFSVSIAQQIYMSEASTYADLGVTVSRPTYYYTVPDPLGVSLPTAPWKIPKPDPAPEFGFRTAASSASPTCATGFVPPYIDYAKAAPFLGASMTEQQDARVFGPVDWVFLQLNAGRRPNVSLEFMTLSVDAAEVIPRPSQNTFAFLLAGANPPPATAAMGGAYLDWASYASFLSFRAVDTISGTRPLQFAFVPGQLLRSGCSQTVVFRVEASIKIGGSSQFIRLMIPVSQNAVRPGPDLKTRYFSGLADQLAQSIAAGSFTAFTLYIAGTVALVVLTFIIAAYRNPSLVPSIKLQFRIFLGALHIVDMPLKPSQRPQPGQQRAVGAGAAVPSNALRSAAPPSLAISATSGSVSSTTNRSAIQAHSSAAGEHKKTFGTIETETRPRKSWQDEDCEQETLPRKDDEERVITPKPRN